ncbi:unnamed protein product, partial [marine sediment metagenome]
MPRKELTALSEQRASLLKEKIEKAAAKEKEERKPAQASLKPSLEDKEKLERKEEVISPKRENIPVLEGIGGSQHRYLQNLIKRTTEEKSYRAIIEEST